MQGPSSTATHLSTLHINAAPSTQMSSSTFLSHEHPIEPSLYAISIFCVGEKHTSFALSLRSQ